MNVETLNSQHKLASWARLFRFHTALPTALIPILAYITVEPLTLKPTLTILFFAMLSHIHICAHNDLVDYPEDKLARDKQHRPLVSGQINLKNVKYFLWIAAVVIVVGATTVNPIFTGVVILGLVFGKLYNRTSGNKVYGDIFYVLAILILASYGPALAQEVTTSTLFLFGALTIHGFYQVQEGHMKDLVEDEQNMIQYLGVRVEDSEVHYPQGFKFATANLKIIEAAFIMTVINRRALSAFDLQTVLAPAFVVFILALALYGYSLSAWLVPEFDRDKIIKFITLHEVSTIIMVLLAVMTHDLRGALIFIIATPLWLVVTNYFIHGDLIAPDI